MFKTILRFKVSNFTIYSAIHKEAVEAHKEKSDLVFFILSFQSPLCEIFSRGKHFKYLYRMF